VGVSSHVWILNVSPRIWHEFKFYWFKCYRLLNKASDLDEYFDKWRKHRLKTNAYMILVGNPEGRRQLGRRRRRWEDTIKMNLREIEWGGMNWIHLPQNRGQWRALVNTVTNLRIPFNFNNFLSSWATGGFLTRTQLHWISFCLVRFKCDKSAECSSDIGIVTLL
jgi:hypothetical protein